MSNDNKTRNHVATTRWAYCVDCEWTGKASEVTMKWGSRFCPKCKSRRVEVRSESELVQMAASLPQADEDRENTINDLRSAVDDYHQLRQMGDLGGVEFG